MNQTEKARRFAELQVKGSPLVLFNAWDAGSAKSIVAAGAQAIATSSWSVAEAQGYRDGEAIPIELAEQIIARIAATIDVPVSVDFEGGYSEDDGELAANISRLLELGVIGINFEDRVVKGSGLYDIDRQARRLVTIRKAAEQKRVALFINARTDLFLGRAATPHSLSAKLWRGPRLTRQAARPVSSFPGWQTMRSSGESARASRCPSRSWSWTACHRMIACLSSVSRASATVRSHTSAR
jgi:2-methylisocitrate lyase-like PEP mutase family enzyme